MKNILVLTPNIGIGGQERVAINMLNVLKKNYNMSLAVFSLSSKFYQPDIDVIDIKIPATNNIFKKICNVIRRAWRLRQIVYKNKIDVVISIATTANIVNIIGHGNAKTIIQKHGFEEVGGGFVNQLTYKFSDAITCCSQSLVDLLLEYAPYTEKYAYELYNPNDIDMIYKQSAINTKIYNKKYINLVTIGRIEPVKNYDRLIKAVKILNNKYSNVCLNIIGDGSQRNELENLVKELGLQKKVKFQGMQSNPYAFLPNSDIFVLSSYHEGLSNALIEGMCFCASVSVDCECGPKEILSDDMYRSVDRAVVTDYGVLVPSAKEAYKKVCSEIDEDDISLAEGIKLLIDDETLRKDMQEKARIRAKKFNMPAYEKKLCAIIEKVLTE